MQKETIWIWLLYLFLFIDSRFEIENENYVLHLPEFVDHFHEWDGNGDTSVTMDEVTIATSVNLHILI